MANFATLLQTIASNIYTNGRNEIDAADLKSVLNAMVEELGQAGYIFKGVAQPSTNPGTPDTNVFYLAGVGTFTNFGGTTVDKGHIGVFAYNGSWSYQVLTTGAWFDSEVYPSEDALEITFYDSDDSDGVTIKINANVSNLGNSKLEAISAWWAAQKERKINLIAGYTIDFDSLDASSPSSLGVFKAIQTGQIIDSYTNATSLIFGTDGGQSVAINKSQLPYTATANLINVKSGSGTLSNVSIKVRGSLENMPSYININEIANHPAAYANAAAALADVPEIYRRKGTKVVYYDDDTQVWIEMLCYDDAGGANWWTDVDNNWAIEGPIETKLATATGGQQLQIAGEKRGNLDDVLNVNAWNEQIYEYESKADARAAVPANKRKLGGVITYLIDGMWYTEQFIGSSTSTWTTTESDWKVLGPVSVSQNTLSIGGEEKGELAGQLIENPEWVWVIIDSNNHVIAGIRSDASVDWIKGVPRPVKDYIDNLIAILFSSVSNIEDFIGTLIEGQKNLQQLLDEKVDKVTGKSLLDKEYADCLSSAQNIEWSYLIKDANNKIILGIKNNLVLFYAGVLHTEKGLEISDFSVSKAVSEEYVEVVLGINGKIIAATYVDGSHYIYKLKSETIEALKEEINQNSITTITLTDYETLIKKGERTPYMLVEEGPNGQCIKVFVGDKEINVTSRYNVENTLVRAYLHSFLYDNNDYSYTKITDYCNLPFSTERSYPFPAYVSIDKDSIEPSIVAKTIVETYLEDTLFRTDEFDGLINNIPVFNLIPGKEYQFKVKYKTTDNYIYPHSVGRLTIIGQERMIYIDGMYNFRDIGGWPTIDGRTIKYDMLFRSAELERGQQGSITAAGINELLNNIKIDVELDFGDESSSSPIEDYVEFLHGSDYQIRAYDDGLNPNSIGYRGTQYKNCFNAILNRLRNGYKILFHCNAGCDRTGTFAFILEGLLGVSESDLSKDYELSSMAWLRTRVAETGVYNYASMVSYIKSNFTGDTLNDKITNMMISFGVLSADITEFKSLMLN